MTFNKFAGTFVQKGSLLAVVILALLHIADATGRRVGFSPGLASAQQAQVVLVNAASYANDSGAGMAPNSIGALYGQFVTQGNLPYPAPAGGALPTSLGGVSVSIGGKSAQLFFAGPTQINLLVPPDLADGNAAIVVTNSDSTTRSGTTRIVRVEPGIFTALSTGTGTAAALTTKDGLTYSYVANSDGTPRDIDPGTKQRPNFLVLYGTGIRLADIANLAITIQGVPVRVEYAGPTSFAGLDQINFIIPPELSGFGTVLVRVRVGTRSANQVTVRIGGELPPITLTQIAEGQVVSGQLSADDQVQPGGSNASNTFFFDAYVFQTTAPNTTVAIDMRGTNPLNPLLLLYRNDNGRLVQVGQDDDTGYYGAPDSAANFNALLLTVIQTPGQYAIFASSSDSQPNGIGSYTLRYTTNVIQPISYGQTVSGQISTTDYKNSADTYLDLFWFNGVQGERPAISLSSSAFDSYLILNGNAGDPPLAFNDNATGVQTLNSLINNYTLTSSGVFIIIATPFEPNKTGAYTLGLARQTTSMSGIGGESLALENLLPAIGRDAERLEARRGADRLTGYRPLATREVIDLP